MPLSNRAHRAGFSAQLRLNGEAGVFRGLDGSPAEVAVRGVRAQTPFREGAVNGRGGRITRSADWLFDAETFYRHVGRWPNDGDTLTVVSKLTRQSVTYRVTPFNDEPVYRTEVEAVLRVHTQELSVEA